MSSWLQKTVRGASPALAVAGVIGFGSALAGAAPPGPERQAELVRLVRNDCGSCHGLTLKGGLGPSLLPETLRGKDEAALVETILRGRTGTAMPPWANFLSANEAGWIVEQLQKGFPDAR